MTFRAAHALLNPSPRGSCDGGRRVSASIYNHDIRPAAVALAFSLWAYSLSSVALCTRNGVGKGSRMCARDLAMGRTSGAFNSADRVASSLREGRGDTPPPVTGLCSTCNCRADLNHLCWECPVYNPPRLRALATIKRGPWPSSLRTWACPEPSPP
ncbi:hypothetical protein MRX96_006410 [Rhipicephalus microplus]